ncbi:MAG: L-ribulose-5-phosphate 4-epimerase AraD [Planctomycetales bacterium]|nr:L-ribulose-5-phosphate 4-epimerase AraD [Planctomycetales bacterium]
MSKEFDKLREQVCQANLDLVAHGLVTLTWGNVSGLSADGLHFAIKPSGVPYDDMEPDQMVVVSVESGQVVEGELRPSSDTPTHRLLYASFTGVGGIVHTHSPKATAFAQARREIPCLGTTHADHFHGPVPVTRPLSEREVEDGYEAHTGDVIVERFAELDPVTMPGVLVAGHAPFAWGQDAAEAVKNAVALEAVANMALDALLIDPDARVLEPYVLDKHYTRKHGKDAYYGQDKS